MDDEQTLLDALAEDLDHAFWQLATTYQDRLYIFALRLTGSIQDAEDSVQEALLGAYITLSHYPAARRRTLKLRPWLYKLLLNVVRNHRRHKYLLAMPLDLRDDGQALDLADTHKNEPERFFEQMENQQEMAKLVRTLPEQYQIVITCYYFEDLSYQEISELLDLPLGTVKSRLHRGLKVLHQTIQAQNRRSNTYGRR